MAHDTSCEQICPPSEQTPSVITALLSQACVASTQQVAKRAPGRTATLSGPHLAVPFGAVATPPF